MSGWVGGSVNAVDRSGQQAWSISDTLKKPLASPEKGSSEPSA